MVLKKLKNTFKSGSSFEALGKDEYIEVDVEGATPCAGGRPSSGKIGIRIESMTEFGDTEKVLRFLREGSVVMLKIKTLKEKDLSELKRAVDRLKRTILAQNGDLVGIEQDWLLLVPEHVTVHR
jgi:SepF-like predicted cell division protein (DUF552 family)